MTIMIFLIHICHHTHDTNMPGDPRREAWMEEEEFVNSAVSVTEVPKVITASTGLLDSVKQQWSLMYFFVMLRLAK